MMVNKILVICIVIMVFSGFFNYFWHTSDQFQHKVKCIIGSSADSSVCSEKMPELDSPVS